MKRIALVVFLLSAGIWIFAGEVRFSETEAVLPIYAPGGYDKTTVVNVYAKFAGENSAMERAAKAREKADELKRLLEQIEQ